MLLTEHYKALLNQLHKTDSGWGTSGRKFAPMVQRLVNDFKPQNVLDYGCGKGTLSRALPFRIINYDPAIPGVDKPPPPTDLVVCLDVLEHIEPECLDDVLDDLQRVTMGVLFCNICTVPAVATLPDGRNAHLTVHDYRWWLPRIMERFEVIHMTNTPPNLQFLVKALSPKGNGHG